MNAGNDIENVVVKAEHPQSALAQTKADVSEKRDSVGYNSGTELGSEGDFITPTDEEMHTLRRVSGKIPWAAYTIAFVELCERFSYYGTTAVFVNFIQQDLPPGSNTYVNPDRYLT
jgi:POT family proton-dependent oligopeptide transporter